MREPGWPEIKSWDVSLCEMEGVSPWHSRLLSQFDQLPQELENYLFGASIHYTDGKPVWEGKLPLLARYTNFWKLDQRWRFPRGLRWIAVILYRVATIAQWHVYDRPIPKVLRSGDQPKKVVDILRPIWQSYFV